MKTNYLPVWAIGLLVAASLLSSCEKNLDEALPAGPTTTATADTGRVIKKGTYRGRPITYEVKDGKAIWQGDILLTPQDLAGGSTPNARLNGLGIENVSRRWPYWTIPYEISDQLPTWQVTATKAAIKDWETNTPIRFRLREGYDKDYIRFVPNNLDISFAANGRQGGMQEVSLNENSGSDIITHELGHVIGLYHEFSRPDREDHINLLWQNMTQEGIDTYSVIGQPEDFVFGPFDINSIMMYSKLALAKKQPDGSFKNVWVPKDNVFVKDPEVVSTGAARTVKAMYANLYVVQGETLYAANAKDGAYVDYSGYWKGAAKTITINGHDMYAMQNGNLYRIERLTGKYTKIGNGNWTGAVGVTGMDLQGYMYAQAGTRLWKIDANGNFTRLGGPAALENWTGTQAVYYHNNALYVIWKNTLYKVNTTTGKVDMQYGGDWQNVKGMAADDPTSNFLYIIIHSSMWRVDVNSGALVEVAYNQFPNTEGMTRASFAGPALCVVSDGKLWRVHNGNKFYLNATWSGTTSMGGF